MIKHWQYPSVMGPVTIPSVLPPVEAFSGDAISQPVRNFAEKARNAKFYPEIPYLFFANIFPGDFPVTSGESVVITFTKTFQYQSYFSVPFIPATGGSRVQGYVFG